MMERLLDRLVPEDAGALSPAARSRCGMVSGAVGICLNLLLFAGKLAAGLITGAISVTADAFNNLSDAASCVVTLIGFRLAGQKPDAEHPFGHGRMEYLTGLGVSVLILLVGLELGKSAIGKIIHPEETALTALTAVILLCSVGVKLWMGWFNGALGRRIRSDALNAAAADSRSDALATSAVLLGLVIARFTGLGLDGYLGLLVAAVIVKTGVTSIKDTVDPLLGKAADPEEVRAIEEQILSHPQVVGIHDLVIHDYGPGRRMMSVHAEVPASGNFLELHDVIDAAERELRERFQIDAVIHMDPIQTDDPKVERLRTLAAAAAAEIDPAITIHDFRITAGPLHTNLIFDVVIPYGVPHSDGDVKAALDRRLREQEPNAHMVIWVDHSYVL